MTSIIGSSAILSYRSRYIFEIQKEHKWEKSAQGLEIGIGCIGGSSEGGEAPAETLQREAREEIQAAVKILPWNKPFIITDEFAVRDCQEEGIDNLFFYWQGTHRPYQNKRVCVFLGEIYDKPCPDDLPGILLSDLGLLMECFQQGLTLGQALNRGVELIYSKDIPLESRIKPVGTTVMLQELYLKHQQRIRHLLH